MERPDVQSWLRLHHRRFDALETLCAHNGTAALRAAVSLLDQIFEKWRDLRRIYCVFFDS